MSVRYSTIYFCGRCGEHFSAPLSPGGEFSMTARCPTCSQPCGLAVSDAICHPLAAPEIVTEAKEEDITFERRERVATAVMQGMMAAGASVHGAEGCARTAVQFADALIKELDGDAE